MEAEEKQRIYLSADYLTNDQSVVMHHPVNAPELFTSGNMGNKRQFWKTLYVVNGSGVKINHRNVQGERVVAKFSRTYNRGDM